MAAIFKHYRNLIGTGGTLPDLTSDTIKVALIDTGTNNPDVDADDFYDDVSSGTVGTPETLGSKTWTYGSGVWTFDAGDTTFSSYTGNSVEEIVIYWDTGTPGTSLLLAQLDEGDITNFAYTPDGSNLTIAWASTGIFTI